MAVQDVILRAGKALPLYARVVEAGVPQAIVLPAVPGSQLQVGTSWQLLMCNTCFQVPLGLEQLPLVS